MSSKNRGLLDLTRIGRTFFVVVAMTLGLFGNDSRNLFAATVNPLSGCPATGAGTGNTGSGPLNSPGASLNVFSSAFAQQAAPCPTANGATGTQQLANERQALMVTNSVLAGMILGRNEQINCNDCITAFGSAGSFSFGLHGRKQITQDLSVVGGAAFAEYRSGGVSVTSTPIFAGLIRYDWTELGNARPFAEIGGVASPGQRVVSNRLYEGVIGQGNSGASSGSVFGRIGWLNRFTPRDEVAVSVELAHDWQRFGGYSEGALPSNPFPLVTPGGTDQLNYVLMGGQWTHLWNAKIETQINLGVARSFGSVSGLNATVTGVSIPTPLKEYTWGEYGLRVGYRIRQNVILDAFADGTLGDRPINTTIHGGIAVRYSY